MAGILSVVGFLRRSHSQKTGALGIFLSFIFLSQVTLGRGNGRFFAVVVILAGQRIVSQGSLGPQRNASVKRDVAPATASVVLQRVRLESP